MKQLGFSKSEKYEHLERLLVRAHIDVGKCALKSALIPKLIIVTSKMVMITSFPTLTVLRIQMQFKAKSRG